MSIQGYTITPSRLDYLERLSDEFHLTGSRFFGTAGIYSDFDFFVKNRPGLADELEIKGFKDITSRSNYVDSNVVKIYRFKGERNEQIDIQIVMDADMKRHIQDCFKECGNQNPTTKDWNMAFSIFRKLKVR